MLHSGSLTGRTRLSRGSISPHARCIDCPTGTAGLITRVDSARRNRHARWSIQRTTATSSLARAGYNPFSYYLGNFEAATLRAMLPRMADEMDQIRILIEKAGIRRRQRLRLNIPVCLVVERPDKVLLVSARFRDISDDGVAVFAGVELAIDSEVQLEFTPPFHRGPLRVRAVVRNRREYVYGLEFLPRDAEEEQTLLTLKALLLPTGTKAEGSLDDRRWT